LRVAAALLCVKIFCGTLTSANISTGKKNSRDRTWTSTRKQIDWRNAKKKR
ncbi:unnamed protein product, partial [Amoebophrya sp. A120]